MSKIDEHSKIKRDLDFITGQVHLLTSFLVSVIDTHPEPNALWRHFERANQAASARAQLQPGSDDFLDGQRELMLQLKGAIENAGATLANYQSDLDRG
jgi:hypothetical protein